MTGLYQASELGPIPMDWQVCSLGSLGEALIGLTYTPSDVKAHGTLVLRSSNIQDEALAFDDNVFVDCDIPERIKVRAGDVLICVRNGSRSLIGKAALLDSRVKGMTFGAFMAVYRSPIGPLVKYLLQSEILKRQINEHLGATINQITNKSLNSFRIPLAPSDAERDAITSALGDIDKLLEGLDRIVAKKRDLKQAAMQQLLTGQTRLPGFQGEWAVKRLGELGTTYGGLTGKSKADFGTGTATYVTFMNVMTNTVIDHTTFESVCVSPSENQNRVERGDLLFNGSSETPEEVALCSLVTSDVSNLFLNSFCFGFRPRESAEADGLFLTYYIRSSNGREIMKSLAQGSTRYNLSKRALLAAEVTMPGLPEQVAIATALADMDAELTALEARRDKTRALKQGMMQELLTGKTRLV
ncbi:MAG: restriction endonuclease subunit S [Hydrogenophaga sp.]|nr:restriction endonuclease subunit S [Hydrogenophaga sp.]